jgi:hypothetical protein
MATKNYYFTGECEWAKLAKPDTKFDAEGVYTLDLYMDGPSWEKFQQSGVQLKTREKNGRSFVKLKRPVKKLIKGEVKEMGPPVLLDADGEEYHEHEKPDIGNGSRVTCKVAVYDTLKGKGHTLEAVRVDDLVIYEANKDRPEEGEAF